MLSTFETSKNLSFPFLLFRVNLDVNRVATEVHCIKTQLHRIGQRQRYTIHKNRHPTSKNNHLSKIANLPSMEEEDMNNCGTEAGKAECISHRKESAEIEAALTVIRIEINMEVRIYNG